MKLPRNLMSRSFIVIGFSVTLYAAIVLVFGWDDIYRELAGFSPVLFAALAGLSLVNYALRFWRWELFLRELGVLLPVRESIGLYFATYIMVITPGKIGEVFKAAILRERFGVSLAKGLPVVLAERLYDFLAVLILAAVGVFFWPGTLAGLTTGLVSAAMVPVVLILLRNRGLRTRLLSRASRSSLVSKYRLGLDESLESFSTLLGVGPTLYGNILSIVAWFCECLGLWLVCRSLGLVVPLPDSVFVYAAGTLVGSLSFLPGGLGGTEATIIWLLQFLEVSGASAAAVALMVRLFTLWLAVLIGLVFFLFFRRNLLQQK